MLTEVWSKKRSNMNVDERLRWMTKVSTIPKMISITMAPNVFQYLITIEMVTFKLLSSWNLLVCHLFNFDLVRAIKVVHGWKSGRAGFYIWESCPFGHYHTERVHGFPFPLMEKALEVVLGC